MGRPGDLVTPQRLTLFAAAVAVVSALAALIGRVAGIPALCVQFPGSSAMFPGTAFGMLLIGSGFLLAACEWRRAATVVSLTMLMYSASEVVLSFAGYWTGWNHALLQVLRIPGPPGMSPSAALLLLFCAIQTLLICRPAPSATAVRWFGGGAFGLVLFTASTAAVAAETPFQWGNVTIGMSFPTALCGGLITTAAWLRTMALRLEARYSTVLISASVTLVVSLTLVSASATRELAEVNQSVRRAYHVFEQLDGWILEIARFDEKVDQQPDGLSHRAHHEQLADLGHRLARIRDLVANNPAQLARADRLHEIVADHARGYPAGLDGHEQLRSIAQRQLATIRAVQHEELDAGLSRAERLERQTSRMVPLGLGGSVVLLFSGFWVLSVAQRRQRQAEAALRKALDATGVQVLERTAELEHANAALSEREELFRFLADAMPQMIWMMDAAGEPLYLNRRWHAYTGQTFEEMCQWGWQKIVHPDDVARTRACWSHALRTGELYECEFRYRGADGNYRWFLERAYPQFVGGKIVRWVGTCTDIHEQRERAASALRVREQEKRALLSELRQAEARLAKIADRVPGIVFQARLDPAGLLSVPYASEALRDIYGFAPEEIQHDASKVFEVVHPDEHEAFRASVLESATTLNPWRIEYRVRRGPDQYRWVLGEGTAERTPDGGTLWHGVVTDITERKRLEDLAELHRREAVNASRQKSEFLATMSHEIRTPMNGVLGMSELLLDTSLDDQQREMTNVIVRSARSLLDVINDILDFSKIEAGKLQLESELFNPSDLIEDVATMLAAAAHKKRLELISDIDPRLNCGVLGDAGRVQQVLTNLLGNALKFTDRGEVLVSAQVVECTEKELLFRVGVRDTGIGMDPATIDRLFQPFTQGDASMTRRFGGTGLGLAICRQLLDLMGGSIGCSSTPGVGSTFTFELRLPRGEGQSAVPEPYHGNVLIVHASHTAGGALVNQIIGMGGSAKAVRTAAEALSHMRSASDAGTPVHIVLLDQELPDTNVFQLGRTMADGAHGAVPRLLLLSSGFGAEHGRPAPVPFEAAVDKPVRYTQLRRTLSGKAAAVGRVRRTSEERGSPASERLRVLLVEDNPANQLVGEMLLKKHGYVVEVAGSGVAALDVIARGSFDVVLMDCQMPGMDGFEATRRIRNGQVRGVDPAIPIIALTACAMESDRERCLEAGMNDYLSKPINAAALNAAVQRTRCLHATSVAEGGDRERRNDGQAGSGPEVLDILHLRELATITISPGRSLARDVAELFAREIDGQTANMRVLHTEGKLDDLAVLAHTLAGSCASAGAKQLRGLMVELEACAQRRDGEAVRLCLGKIDVGIDVTKAEMDRLAQGA